MKASNDWQLASILHRCSIQPTGFALIKYISQYLQNNYRYNISQLVPFIHIGTITAVIDNRDHIYVHDNLYHSKCVFFLFRCTITVIKNWENDGAQGKVETGSNWYNVVLVNMVVQVWLCAVHRYGCCNTVSNSPQLLRGYELCTCFRELASGSTTIHRETDT